MGAALMVEEQGPRSGKEGVAIFPFGNMRILDYFICNVFYPTFYPFTFHI